MEGSCHCGAVRFEVADAPARVTDCNCSICSKLGTLWAYFPPDKVRFDSAPDATFGYVWGDRTIAFHTCRTCGCTTHWAAIETGEPDRMGINARLLTGLHRHDVELRQLDLAEHGHFWTQ